MKVKDILKTIIKSVYLVSVAFCRSLILDIAVGRGILASWERRRNKAWISTLVVILTSVHVLPHVFEEEKIMTFRRESVLIKLFMSLDFRLPKVSRGRSSRSPDLRR